MFIRKRNTSLKKTKVKGHVSFLYFLMKKKQYKHKYSFINVIILHVIQNSNWFLGSSLSTVLEITTLLPWAIKLTQNWTYLLLLFFCWIFYFSTYVHIWHNCQNWTMIQCTTEYKLKLRMANNVCKNFMLWNNILSIKLTLTETFD